eukprot:1644602-Rhodomonas_salina.6
MDYACHAEIGHLHVLARLMEGKKKRGKEDGGKEGRREGGKSKRKGPCLLYTSPSPRDRG